MKLTRRQWFWMLAWAACWLVFVGATYAIAERSSQWRMVRAAHLKVEPACVFCGDRAKLEVHHIIPFHVRPELELADGNLVTLCDGCHLMFGHLGSFRAWNPDVREHAKIYRGWVKSRKELSK